MNTFRKIGPDEWGVQLAEGDARLEPGTVIEITTRAGATKSVTLGDYCGMQYGKHYYRVALDPAKAAARATENENAAPVPVTHDRITITGEVLTVKFTEGRFPGVKMLIKTDEGYKVWGTRPAALIGVERGDRVRFVAGVKPSNDDPKFGFFTRPANGVILNHPTKEAA